MAAAEALAGINMIDFSSRLPGPLAGSLLAQLGAKVYKVEDVNARDPFSLGLPGDDSFQHWYEQLNAAKELCLFDFDKAAERERFAELLWQADGIILGRPLGLRESLGLGEEQLRRRRQALVVVQAAGERERPLHDINALALTGLLGLHVREGKRAKRLNPPFMPLAGAALGQQLAMDMLAGLLSSRRTGRSVFIRTSLTQACQAVWGKLWPPSLQGRHSFLHNGLYPCYNIYRISCGGHVALAAVEEKFWLCLVDWLKLPLNPADRFSREERVFAVLEKALGELGAKDIAAAPGPCCLTPV